MAKNFMNQASPRILVIRRDNIGDLLCTTPLLHGLRKKYPEAFLAVLASSYNAEILKGNPDVDQVFVFLKRHQQQAGNHWLARLWKRWSLIRKIRRLNFDHIILANGGWRYARQLGGKQLIGFREQHQPDDCQPDIIVPLEENGRHLHEVAKMARLGAVLDAHETMGRLKLFPDQAEQSTQRERLLALGWDPACRTVALHISSRQPGQRWPKESFVALVKELSKFSTTSENKENARLQFFLFWSPGEENNPMHPGDDRKAAWILAELKGYPIFPSPTKNLRELIAGISLVDQMICSDGGAMHVAAALQKPLLCFFGASSVEEWHPWQVPHCVLQAPSHEVAAISVEEVVSKLG